MTKKKKSVRRLSVKQRAALAKGRSKLKAKRSKRVGRKNPPIIIKKELDIMGARKRASRPRSITVFKNMGFDGRRKRSRRKSARYMGFDGKRRKRSRRAYFLGADAPRGIIGNLADLGIILAGAIGGSFAARQIPLPVNVKPFIPLVAGLVLSMMSKKKFLKQIGSGMMVAGGLSVIRQYIPQVPVLSGEPTILIPVREDGTPLLGAPSQFGQEYTDMVHVTGANM